MPLEKETSRSNCLSTSLLPSQAEGDCCKKESSQLCSNLGKLGKPQDKRPIKTTQQQRQRVDELKTQLSSTDERVRVSKLRMKESK